MNRAGQPTSASRRHHGRRSARRGAWPARPRRAPRSARRWASSMSDAGAGEVEQLALVDRAREHDDLDALGHVAQLEVEALLAADGEGADGDVDRGAQRAVHEVAGHVHHVDPVDRPRQRVPQRARCRRRRRRPGCGRRGGWAGRCPGSAALASRAGSSGPRANTTSSPVSRSAATTRSGITRSSKVAGVSPRLKIARRPWLEKRWSSRVRRFQARESRPPGNTSSPAERLPGRLQPLDARGGSARRRWWRR